VQIYFEINVHNLFRVSSDEALGGEVRHDVQIQVYTVFLFGITLEAGDPEFLYQAVGSLDAVKELDDPDTQFFFGLGVPFLKGAVIEKVDEYLGDVVEEADYGVGLQAEVVAVEKGIGGESHYFAVFVDH